MSDIGISFDAQVQPSPVGARFGLAFWNTALRATVQSVGDFVVVLKPSGNISEQIVSGVAWPLAQLLGVTLPTLGKNLIQGQSFEVLTVSPSTQTVAGETLTVKPADLSLSNHGDMLMLQGSVDFS